MYNPYIPNENKKCTATAVVKILVFCRNFVHRKHNYWERNQLICAAVNDSNIYETKHKNPDFYSTLKPV